MVGDMKKVVKNSLLCNDNFEIPDDYQLWPMIGYNICSCYITNYVEQYNDVVMGSIASQITSPTIVYSAVYSGADQRKDQSSASLAFLREFTGERWIPRTKGQ